MCMGLASGYKKPHYTVDAVVCDYGVFENGKLMEGMILNSRANALRIADILNADVHHHVYKENGQVIYLCNRKRCDVCHPECMHTSDVKYAVDFCKVNDDFIQSISPDDVYSDFGAERYNDEEEK